MHYILYRRGFAPIIILLLVAVIVALGVGGYVALKKNQESRSKNNAAVTQAPTTVVDTSTWKTYTNSQYGFEFRYPPIWGIMPGSLGVSVGPVGSTPTDIPLSVVVFDQPLETAEAQLDEAYVKSHAAIKSEISINDIPAVKYSSTASAAISADIILVPFLSKTYEIIIIHTSYINQSMQILSTFKFIQ